ncbi:60S ribosomal protein L44 [Blastomyces percursus]|uniref:60S ribosomal protein L44 n=1 Tax=Blastomyces percursus TaxID=1658174 RepID=A0A1J9R2K9_9EURO|nr:60S ribosomal protein L44 [Blastomyces percursus]
MSCPAPVNTDILKRLARRPGPKRNEIPQPAGQQSTPPRLPTTRTPSDTTSSSTTGQFSQNERLRWSNEACVQEEGKDHKEGCSAVGVHSLQDQGAAGSETMQAL